MKTQNTSILSRTIVWLFLICATCFAQIPQTINYQGLLTDADGKPVADGQVTLAFKLYDAATDGNMLWQETQQVEVAGGLFNVILGSSTPLNLPFDAPYWLGLSVGGDPELEPRIGLTAAAYSLNSRSIADTAVSTAKIQDDAVIGAKIAEGQVVRSINTLSDSVRLVAGDNIGIMTDADSIVISANVNSDGNGDITAVHAGDGLTGGGESGEVTLGIGDKGVTTMHLADDAVTSAKILDGQLQSQDVTADFTAPYADTAAYALTSPQSSDGHSLDAADGDPANVVFVDNDGKVGVGTTSPAEKLDVVGNVHASGGFIAGNTTTYSDGQILTNEDIDITTAVTSQLYVDITNNRVGIGPTTPAEKLDVAGTVQMTGSKMPTGATSDCVLTSNASGKGTWQQAAGGADNDWTISGNDMYSAVSGNVGIGTTTPGSNVGFGTKVLNLAGSVPALFIVKNVRSVSDSALNIMDKLRPVILHRHNL